MASHQDPQLQSLKKGQIASILYHDIFDYPLAKEDLVRWEMGSGELLQGKNYKILYKNGFYFVEGREEVVKKRLARKAWSRKKLLLAKNAALWLERVPTVLFVGITGSLAMENASLDSDIDLMIITKKNTLWTTRACVYLLFVLLNIPVRRPMDPDEKDKLCLNIWMDERNLKIDKQSVYTAHELAQVRTLVNKDDTYERLIESNKWIFSIWPKSVDSKLLNYKKSELKGKDFFKIFNIVEKLSYKIQFSYMKVKISRELITPTRAFFHPFDWKGKVAQELKKRT